MRVGRWQLTEVKAGGERLRVPLENRAGGGYRVHFRYADAARLGIEDGGEVMIGEKPFGVHAMYNPGGSNKSLVAVLLARSISKHTNRQNLQKDSRHAGT